MKAFFTIGVALVFAVTAGAGVVGWLTAETRDWAFIQRTGGIRIASPVMQAGRPVLPVDYMPTGNSGLVVRRIDLDRQDSHLVISIVTQVVETGCSIGRTHYVDLSGIPPGFHEIHYETAGDPAKHLGRIIIK
jgi:hypothetical protein